MIRPTAKDKMLAAGVRLYGKLTPAELFRGLHPGAIASEAGYSRSSFYQQWPNVQDYWTDLAEHVARTGLRTEEPIVATDEDYLPGLNRAQEVRNVIRKTQLRDFYNMDPEDFKVSLGLASKADPGSPLNELVGDNYRNWFAQVEPVAQAGLDAWNREPRPPFDLEQVMAAVIALLDGYALRRIADPGPVTDELITETILLITMALTRHKDDPTTMDDVTAPIEDFPNG
jgi:AcrR family transcriptional regulator